MADDSLLQRQEEEWQVLQAVYMDDVVDLRKKVAWKVERPLHICLVLKQQQSESVAGTTDSDSMIHMVIKCPNKYPDLVPEISLENAKGLSNEQIAVLNTELIERATSMVGEVMVLELAQHVQTFLRDNYKGPQKSFYEEMLSNQLKQQEKQKLEQQKRLDFLKRKEEKERQLLEDEIQKRQHALKEETKKIKETKQISDEKPTDQEKAVPATPNTEVPTCSPIGTPSTPRRPRMSHSPSPLIVLPSNENKYNQDKRRRRTSTPLRDTDDSDHQCKDHTGGIVVIAFNTKSERTIHRGTCLGHSVHGSTVYAGIDTASGELVAISEWVLKWRHIKQKRTQRVDYEDKEGATYLKQITSIEQEIHSLIRLRHKNLIHYLAIKYIQEAGKCTVYILMDYSGGASLNIHITESRPLSVDIIKAYTEEILYGLEYLHKKDVVHKYLRASSIVVDKNGRIRIGDYSIDKRLSDLYYAVESSRPGVHFSGDRELIPVRGGKKGDVYQLGLILLSVAIGLDADPDKPEIPQNFPPVFQDFLTKCLMKDERHRWSVYQLLDHSFIKEELPHTIHYAPHKPAATEENEKKQDVNKDNDSEDDDLADLPFITALEASGQSRLTNEFEVLRSLGKGGFGDVIEVRNKLDRRKYAIKRIPLNPKSKYFNKKITREVKLLSRLNHENVVRYYNSWIETSEDPALSDSSTSCSTTTGTGTTGKTQTTSDSSSLMKNSLNFTDDIEKFAPQARDVSVEWSMSYNTTGIQKIHNDSSDSEDEAEVFGTSFFGKMDTSDDVLFEHDSSDKSEDEEAGINKSNKNIEPEQVAKLQYLYIQMEFCERSTLRNCIDAGLYLDINRLWRFFREIVEGLVHIHEQGMIHRDLKPVNIFLDSNDHVKIGDFGLATTSVLASQPNIDATMFSLSALESREGVSKSMSRSDGAGDLTGKVGTALYVSPEMMTKMSYSQKVDMYSLGVIFFEMCYRPLTTGMERVQILANLRSMDIVFPEDFDQLEMKNQTGILKMLMNHDPSQRPTSAELLKSEYMPPPQLEEAEQNEILRSTISDPHSKAYKRLINELFSQTITSADDHLYDSDFHKGGITIKTALTNELVYENLIRIFQKHGAIPVLSPFFMPKSSVYDKSENYPCFMDHSGLLIGLPFDLRAPFARYIARNNITNLKRYCIGKVFRTKKLHKLHPRELTECAFDIVTSSQGSLIPDAEILIIVQEIINEFPALQSRSYYVKINHVTILRAVLMHSGIEDHLFDDVMTALSGPKVDSKTHTKSLNSLGLSEQVISSLLNFLEMEGPFSKISSFLRCITKTKGEAASLAKQGLHELETVINHAVSMGCKLQMIVSLGFLYSVHQYSGVIFQVMCDHRKKNRNIPDVLAVGGRFDDLISKFHSPITHSLSQQYSITQHAVGVSIHFEKIVSALVDYPEYQPSTRCDILVCAIGHKPMLKDRMTIIKDLWAAGLKAELLLETIQAQEDIQDICRSAGISHMVVIKDGDSIKVRSIDKDKIAEKKLTPNDPSLTEFLLQKIQSNKIEQNDTKSQLGVCNITFSQPHSETVQSQSNSSNMTLNFIFIMMEGKLALNTRKKYELQIHGKVTTSLSWLPGKTCDVVAVELNVSVIKTVAAYLELNGNQKDFNLSISSIIEKHPKHRKYLSNVFDQIFELKFERKTGNDKGLKPLLDEDSSPDIVDDDDDEMMETQGGTKHRKLTRAEKSKNAAKNRRDKEAVEFNNIIEALPFPNEDLEKMDKSSVVKLTTSYLKMLELIEKEMKSLKIDNKVKEKETTVCKPVSSNEIVLSNDTPLGESQLMLEALNCFLILLDRKRKILFVSKNVEDHLGISQVQLIGKTVEDFIEEKDIPELRKQFNLKFMSQSDRCESMEADDSHPEVKDIYHQLDEHRMFYVRMLCQYKNNKTKYKGHTLVQWTGRLKMRKTNKANNFATTGLLCTCKVMQTNSILEIKMDGNMFMSRHDLGMTFTFCDPRIITLIGYEPSEVIGRTAYQFHNPLDAERVRVCHSNLIVQGSSVSKYYRFVGKNCDWVWMQTRATIIYNTNNVPQYIVCMNYIISEEEGVRVLMEEDKECLSCTGVMEISSKPVKVKDSSKGDNPDHHSDNGYHSSYSPYSSINPSPLSESSMSHKQFESDDCGGGDTNDDFPMSVVQECASSLDPDGADDEEMIKFIESLDSESDMAKNIQQLADNVQWNRGHSSQMASSKKRSLQRIKSCPQVLSLLPINDSDVDDQPIQFTCRPSGTAFFQDPANQFESGNNLGNNFEIPKPGLLNIQIGSFNDGNLGGSSTLTEALPKEISDFCMQYAESMADIQSQDVMMQYGHDSLFPDLEGLHDHSGRIGGQSMNGSGIVSPGSQHSYGSPQPLQNNTQTVIPNSQTVIPNSQTVIQNSQTVIPNSQIVMMNGQTVMPSTQIVISNTQTVMPNTQSVLISQSMLQNPNSVLNTQSVLLNSQPVLSNTSQPIFPTSPQYFARNSDTPNSYLSGSSVMSPPQSYSNLNSPMSVESNISSPQGDFSNIQSPNPQAHACTIGLNNLTMNSVRSPSHNYMPHVNPSQNQQNFVGHRMNGNMDRNMMAKINSGNNMSQVNIGNHIVNNHVKTNGHSLLHNGASQQVLSRMAPPANQQNYQQNKAQNNTIQMASGRSSSTCVAPNFTANNPSKGLRNVKSMSELEKMLRGYSPPFLQDKQSGSPDSSCTLLQQMLTGKLSGEKYIAMEKQRQLNGVIRTSHK